MRYLPKSDSERQEMLAACGLGSAEELFAQIPAEARLHRPLDLPPGISEYEIVDYFKSLSEMNVGSWPTFLGAGVYNHYRPVVVDTVVSRGEFLTAYTPYQSEISQGTLTAIFEFQTMICQLTGMDVANASMYDGSTAVPEAAMMAVRVTGRHRILVAKSVHPEYREVLRTYAKNQHLPVEEFGFDEQSGQIDLADLEAKLDSATACVIIQSPNFFGIVEDVRKAAELAHADGALLVFTSRKQFRSGYSSLHAMPISWRANSSRTRSRLAMAGLSPALWPPKRNSSGSCPAASWGRLPTPTAIARSA